MEFHEWLQVGYGNGWCGPPVCYTHDGLPMSESENDEFNEGDPCIHIIRLYEDAEHKTGIEEAHSASIWRASNAGLDSV